MKKSYSPVILNHKECITKNCYNKQNEGNGVNLGDFWICYPCWSSLVFGKEPNSQIFRNMMKLNNNRKELK